MNNQYDPNNNYNQNQQNYNGVPNQPMYNQPMYNQPVYNQPVVQQNKTNTLCIVGFILSLLCFNVIGLIVCIIGLNSAKKKNEGGRGLAIAGIVISVITLIITIIIVIAGVSVYSTAKNNIYLQTACSNVDVYGNYDSRYDLYGDLADDDDVYVTCEDFECTYHKDGVTLSITCSH